MPPVPIFYTQKTAMNSDMEGEQPQLLPFHIINESDMTSSLQDVETVNSYLGYRNSFWAVSIL